jgi:hypothetical protein
MVGYSGESLSHLLDILAEWNNYLEGKCTDIYNLPVHEL